MSQITISDAGLWGRPVTKALLSRLRRGSHSKKSKVISFRYCQSFFNQEMQRWNCELEWLVEVLLFWSWSKYVHKWMWGYSEPLVVILCVKLGILWNLW